MGGHHFSNGATWVEQYARSIGLAGSVRPALAAAGPGATNLDVGAARAYDDGVNFKLGQQVDVFLHRSGGVTSPHALFVIEMGGNDIRDAFQRSLTTPRRSVSQPRRRRASRRTSRRTLAGTLRDPRDRGSLQSGADATLDAGRLAAIGCGGLAAEARASASACFSMGTCTAKKRYRIARSSTATETSSR